MSAFYIMAGVLVGIGGTKLAEGADGRFGVLFLLSFAFMVIAAWLEWANKQ